MKTLSGNLPPKSLRSLDLYPFFEKMVNEAADPLYLAVKLSILGNSMDLMVADPSLTVERSIADKVKLPLSDENYSKFRKQLQATQHLLITKVINLQS